MRMRILGLFAVLLLLLPVGGCSEAAEEREYFDTPVLGQYYVEYKGRVYNTYGTPCRYDATLENTGYLGYRARQVGSMENLKGSFPKGTTFYSFDPNQSALKATYALLAVLPGEAEYYFAVSFDEVDLKTGYDILHPLYLDGSCWMFFNFEDETMGRAWSPDATEEERTEFIEGFAKAPAVTEVPKGDPRIFWMKSYDAIVVQMNLYENGVISIATDPEKAVQLDEQTNALIHRILDGEAGVEEEA